MLGLLIFFTTLLLVIFAFFLGLISIYKHYKSNVVILWFLTSMAITIWGIGYLLSSSAPTNNLAFLYLHIVYFGATLIPILSFHFFAAFLFRDKQYKNLIIFGYCIAFVFLVLINFTRLIISGARYMENFGRYEEVTIIGFKIFLAYFLFFVIFGIYLLIKDYKINVGFRRRQIFYIILAGIFGFVGGISNFVTDLTGIFPYGQLVVWLYPVLIYYGIFMDEVKIKVG